MAPKPKTARATAKTARAAADQPEVSCQAKLRKICLKSIQIQFALIAQKLQLLKSH
jgi:hypothetical protein